MKDLRQSENWGKYLSHFGWKYEFANGVLVLVKPMGLCSVIKVQKPENLSEEALKQIDQIAQKHKALFVKLEPKYDSKIAGFEKNRFPLENPTTIVIDLSQPKEKLWKDLKKDAKYSVNFARKAGCETKFFPNPNEAVQKTFYDLISSAGREKHFYVQSFEDLKAKVKSFGENSVAVLTYKGGVVMAGCFVLLEGNGAFYLHAATSAVGRKLLASYLEMWELMLFLKERGVEKLDLEGVVDERFPGLTKNWYGFSFFKRKFGGKEVKYPYPQIKFFNKFLEKINRVSPLPI